MTVDPIIGAELLAGWGVFVGIVWAFVYAASDRRRPPWRSR